MMLITILVVLLGSIGVILVVRWAVLSAASEMKGKRQDFSHFMGIFFRRIGMAFAFFAVASLGILAVVYGSIHLVPKMTGYMLGDNGTKPEKVSVVDTEEVAKPAPPQKQHQYPLQKMRDLGIKNTPTFEVLTRDGINVIFFKKDGTVSAPMIRAMDDDIKHILVRPSDPESCAIVFPVRHESECQFQTKNSAGEFKPCGKFGADKFGPDEWSIRVACSSE